MTPPPPVGATLPENVLLVRVTVPELLLMMAPPLLPALLPEKVQLVTVSTLLLLMAPPLLLAVLPEKVLPVTLIVLPFPPLMAPPLAPVPRVLLLEKVLLVMTTVSFDPEMQVVLPENVQLVTVNVPPPVLPVSMAPALLATCPLMMAKF
jgi:hypothetical protein